MTNVTALPSISFYALGTDNIIRIYDDSFPHECLKSARKKVLEIDDTFSVFKPYSKFSEINQNAGKTPVKVSNKLIYVVDSGIKYSKESNGAFNMLTGPLIKLWTDAKKNGCVPDESEIEKAIILCDFNQINIDNNSKTILLKNEGQMIDGGSIVKGYAANEVINILHSSDVKSAIIDLGGNIYALGTKPDGSLWKVGIQNPLSERGKIMGAVYASNQAVVTSGNYERFFIAGGKKYHHIIDPKTGYPTDNKIISVTVISSNSMAADALSTCAYNLGIDDGFDFIESKEDAEAIFITEDRRLYITSGMKNNFKLIDDTFMYINKF